ncbi:hypothetical protein M885DRAFT_543445 [Pelagophyceae sp. CCMP2097]|nr:hypothetical protein M885DRAFT_543445 [Pelagophyceae sp. CCMP2097]
MSVDVDAAAVPPAPDGAAEVGEEASAHDRAVRRQVSYYFSDENLARGDDFMFDAFAESGDFSVSLRDIAAFKKMKKLVPDQNLVAIADAVYGSEDVEVVVRTNSGELRVRRVKPLTEECAEALRLSAEARGDKKRANEQKLRTVEVRNAKGADEAALRNQFGVCGEVASVVFAADGGVATALVEFAEPLGAIVAAETLNDVENWRFGLRVTLLSGETPDKARTRLGLPLPPRQKPTGGFSRDAQFGNGAQGAFSPPRRDARDDAQGSRSLPAAEEPLPPPGEGRMRGRLLYIKLAEAGKGKKAGGNYGIIRPLAAEAKEDTALFLFTDFLPKDGAKTLKRNDILDYVEELNDDGRKRAREVRRGPKPTARPAPAPRAFTKAPAADESKGPLSKLAQLANALDTKRGAPADDADAAEAVADGVRPEHLRRFGVAMRSGDALAKTAVAVEQRSVLAKGPDGTAGFATPRTLPQRPSALRGDAYEFAMPANDAAAPA